MTDHKHYYQAMFLLDNQEVRQKGFNEVRDWVRRTLEKHAISVPVLRLWGEREMTYRVGTRGRATYLLGWLEAAGNSINEAKRELYLVGPVFRCLFLEEAAIPEDELALGIPAIADHELVIPEEGAETDDESDDFSAREEEKVAVGSEEENDG
ncbi:MAG: 30S ribosomal protein S6 [Planctomycetota bacterium]|nr:30S ribosomal protein S6 [Planctomycetota bacterium]